MRQPTERKEPIENTEPAEPTLPTDSTEPIEPTESTDPREPMERTESRDHSDHREPFPPLSLGTLILLRASAGSLRPTTSIVAISRVVADRSGRGCQAGPSAEFLHSRVSFDMPYFGAPICREAQPRS